MKYLHYTTLLILTAFIFTGCLDSSNNAPSCEYVDETPFLEENAAKEGVIVTSSGLQYEIISEGNGETAPSNAIIFAEYEGKTTAGTTFVETEEVDYFRLNEGIIAGLLEGISLMDEGATYRFVLPPELGYGENPPQNSPVQCGSVLIFDFTLDSFLEDPEIFMTENAQTEDINITESGLQYRILEEGDSDESPQQNSSVNVRYTGTYTNGYVFDESPESDTVSFYLNQVISGFSEGIQLMNVGDTYQLFLPPELGYGDNPPQNSRIPQDVALIFEVELVSIN